MDKIKISIVDDQNLFRESLALLIDTVDTFEIVSASDSGLTFLEKLKDADIPKPEIVLLDMDMPGMNGIELNGILNKEHPYMRVIILSVHVQPLLIAQMINAGAAAYLAKNCNKEELILAIETVHKTGFYFNNNVLRAIQNASGNKMIAQRNISNVPVHLTGREIQVLRLICKEMSNAEIAEALFLSTRTVEGHRNNLLIKTGCRNTAGLVLFAIKYSVVQLPV
ncbi:MAG: response regulator transcription factor [Mucilaginibacter sp.]